MTQKAFCEYRRVVLYRHTGVGETKFVDLGHELPQSRHSGVWEALAADNIENPCSIYTEVEGWQGLYIFDAEEIPEPNTVINFRINIEQCPAKFVVVGAARDIQLPSGEKEICITVKCIGSMKPELLIYELRKVGLMEIIGG